MEYTEFKMSVVSAAGTFEYMMAEDDRYINLLKQVYGDKVHMPFGYFKSVQPASNSFKNPFLREKITSPVYILNG